MWLRCTYSIKTQSPIVSSIAHPFVTILPPRCTSSSSLPLPSVFGKPKDSREHQNRSLVYFSPTFCLIFVNMPLRLAAWLLSLASSNIVLIKNRWEANRHSKPETETGRASWNSNEDARLQSAIFLRFALRRLSPIELFVQVCYFLH